MMENIPDTAQTTHGIRNIFADIRYVPTSVLCEFFMFWNSAFMDFPNTTFIAYKFFSAVLLHVHMKDFQIQP